MARILIADAGKASLVMSSEVFKDKIPGAVISVARTGQEAVRALTEFKPDMCVVDFDLPDVDGVTLICEMRRHFHGPILLTAYPERIVDEAVSKHLFGYDDASSWLPKPVKADDLAEKIDCFLTMGRRVRRRFDTSVETLLVGKGAGRGKRAPKAAGNVINLSLDGACVKLEAVLAMKMSEEFTLSIPLPVPGVKALPVKAVPAAKKKGASARSGKRPTPTIKVAPRYPEAKIKARIAWRSSCGKMAGLRFEKMSDLHRRGLETLLRSMALNEEVSA